MPMTAEERRRLVVEKDGGWKPRIGMWPEKCCVFYSVDTQKFKHRTPFWQLMLLTRKYGNVRRRHVL